MMTKQHTNDDAMEAVFKALSHPLRRRMVDLIKESPGLSVGELDQHFEVSRIAVLKHLAKLDTAHLVLSQQDGRHRRLYFNAVPIQMIYDRWTTEFSGYWSNQMTRIKYAIEQKDNP